ncbi:MAG: hypothetical protein ACRC9M_03455 [Aeromonas sp.]
MKIKFTIMAISLMLAGCSSVLNGSSDEINVSTNSNANCSINGQNFQAPGSVTVDRSSDDLIVNCVSSDNQAKGMTKIASSATTSAIAGNLLLGGIPGWLVDFGTGNAYNYPNLVMLPLIAKDNLATSKPSAQ